MPASSWILPRQMFPPPTTIAIETPKRLTSAICSAMPCVLLRSTLASSANASPDIFSSTRENRGAGRSLTEGISREAADANSFAERTDRTIDQVADAHRIVFHEGLVEEAML